MLPKYCAWHNKGMSLALLFTDFFFPCRKKAGKITAKPRIFRQKLVFVFIYLKSQCDKNISAETFTSVHWRQLGTFQTFWDLRLALVRGGPFLNANRFLMVAVYAIYLRQAALEGETTAHFTHWIGSVWLLLDLGLELGL